MAIFVGGGVSRDGVQPEIIEPVARSVAVNLVYLV